MIWLGAYLVAAEPEDASAAANAARARGSDLYRNACVSCHGQDGRAARLRHNVPWAPDFTSAAWQRQHADAQLKVTIRDGKGTGMPSFGDRFDEAQSRALIAYLRSLAPGRDPAPGGGAENDFERRFQALQNELEVLRREFEQLLAATENENPSAEARRPPQSRRTSIKYASSSP
jgi:mono/diheme cytochrome c family protein